MIFSIAISALIGWIVLERQARLGIEIKVPHPMDIEKDVGRPDVVIEFRSREMIREFIAEEIEVGQYVHSEYSLNSRLSELENRFAFFYPERHDIDTTLLAQKKKELVALAMKNALTTSDFDNFVAATFVLENHGDQDIYKALEARMIENDEPDFACHFRVFRHFEPSRIFKNPEIVDVFRQHASNPTWLGYKAAQLLYDLNLDKSLLPKKYIKDLESDSPDVALNWLLENAPCKECYLFADRQLDEQMKSESGNYYLCTAIFECNSDDDELQQLKLKTEKRIIEFLRAKEKDGWAIMRFWMCLIKHGTTQSTDLALETLRAPEQSKWWTYAMSLLQSLELDDDYKEVVLSLDRHPPFNSDFLEIYREICGDAATEAFCYRLIEQTERKEAFEMLCSIHERTSNLKAIENIRTHFFSGSNHWRFLEGVRMLDKLGDPKMPSFLKQVKVDLDESRGIGPFMKDWYIRQHTYQDVVDWINHNLNPSTQLTVARVIENPRYPEGHELWEMWSDIDRTIDDPIKFMAAALAHSGHGNLAFYEAIYPGAIGRSIEDVADLESDEFDVRGHGFAQEFNALVVNNRLYHFHIEEGPSGSDERYDVHAMIEIMNAIAIRQNMKRRFFSFETTWDIGFCVVVFLEPDTVKELMNKFGLRLAAGGEYYLDH